MKITQKDVEHIAKLARLELSEEDKERFSREFSDILDYVEKLNEIRTSKMELKRGWLVDPRLRQGFASWRQEANGGQAERINRMREDKVTRPAGEEVRDKFVGLAPEHTDDHIKTISPLK